MTPRTEAIPWARCEKCGQKLVAEMDGDPYCLNCETCPACHDVHHMGDVCQEATEAEARIDALRLERDQAIALSRLPYPTAWAYEQACQAIDTLARADAAEAALSAHHAQFDPWCGHIFPRIPGRVMERCGMPPDHAIHCGHDFPNKPAHYFDLATPTCPLCGAALHEGLLGSLTEDLACPRPDAEVKAHYESTP